MNGNKEHWTGRRPLALIGMSGCGKTFLSQTLANKGFFHYSVDWEIANILRPQILESVIEKIKNQSQFFKNLHENFLLKTDLSLTFDDLSTVTTFVIPLNENNKVSFKNLITNQRLYKAAELQAMNGFFLRFKNNANNYEGIICDATGSIFEVASDSAEMIENLKNNATTVYIETNETHIQTLVTRSKNAIKPILYNERFLNKNLQEYYSVKEINDDFEIDAAFFQWVFPNLLKYRQECYQQLAIQANAVSISPSSLESFVSEIAC